MFNFKKTYNLPFKYHIPNYIEDFYSQGNVLKRRIKFFKRSIYISLMGQRKLELFSILPSHQKILWINVSAPSIGDSLMDLSSRVLLNGRNIDLFTSQNTVEIYSNDKIFNRVYSSPELAAKNKYDLVIIDSYSTRSMKIKLKIASKVNYIGMYGYFNGPELNRVLFSFHQMNNLLKYYYSESSINKIAKPSITVSDFDLKLVKSLNLPNFFFAIVIGGEWEYRTYNKWSEVIDKLTKKNKKLNLVFVGSDNAKESAKDLTEAFPRDNIFNCVAKFTFNQTAQIIKGAKILLCCDGGLMHSANAVNTPIVPLFAKLIPTMRLTESIQAFPLFDANDVNNITVEEIIEQYNEVSSYDDNHLLGE